MAPHSQHDRRDGQRQETNGLSRPIVVLPKKADSAVLQDPFSEIFPTCLTVALWHLQACLLCRVNCRGVEVSRCRGTGHPQDGRGSCRTSAQPVPVHLCCHSWAGSESHPRTNSSTLSAILRFIPLTHGTSYLTKSSSSHHRPQLIKTTADCGLACTTRNPPTSPSCLSVERIQDSGGRMGFRQGSEDDNATTCLAVCSHVLSQRSLCSVSFTLHRHCRYRQRINETCPYSLS